MVTRKVFLTGATGVLGRRVARLLVQSGHHVTALARSDQNIQDCRRMGIDPVIGDIFDSHRIRTITRGHDVIMHLASHMPKVEIPRKKDWQLNDKIRTAGTRNLLEAALTNHVHLFVQPSVTFLYGQQHGLAVDEAQPIPKKNISMACSAIEMEAMVRNLLPDKHIILRFGMFYSADSFHTGNMIQNIKDRKLPVIGDG